MGAEGEVGGRKGGYTKSAPGTHVISEAQWRCEKGRIPNRADAMAEK